MRQALKRGIHNANKLTFLVGGLPVFADLIYDLDMENSELLQNVYDSIRKLDEEVTKKRPDQTQEEYDLAMGAQLVIQQKIRELFKEYGSA